MKRFFILLPLATLAYLGLLTSAAAQGTKADYDRAMSLAGRTENKVFRADVKPSWLEGGNQLWYRVTTGPDSLEFVAVDALTGTKQPAFSHEKLAAALTAATGQPVSSAKPPLDGAELTPEEIRFRHAGKAWTWRRPDGPLEERAAESSAVKSSGQSLRIRPTRSTGAATEITFRNQQPDAVEIFWLDNEGGRRSYGRVRQGTDRTLSTYTGHIWLVTDVEGKPLAVFEAKEEKITAEIDGPGQPRRRGGRDDGEGGRGNDGASPDRKWKVESRGDTLILRHTADDTAFTLDPTNGGALPVFAPKTAWGSVTWSPDSSRFVVIEFIPVEERTVHFVESSPRDQIQPKLQSKPYRKPGDALPKPRPVVFTVADRKAVPADTALLDNPFVETGDLDARWLPGGEEFALSSNQRGHQLYRIVAANAATGQTRVVVEEKSDTFIDWTEKTWRRWLDKTGELLWMSERDGWCHLYLYDAKTGALKNPVTGGAWVVRGVESVDEEKRQVWFFASGLRDTEDPYHKHLCRVNFDGSGFVRLTEGDGNHRVEFSPDRRFFVDTWSRPDHPPVTVLRSAEDGRLITELERADWSALLAAGWSAPERFTAKGRDGVTDIYGVIVKPSNFDPAKRYPVVEEVYAGPHDSFAPKEFGRMLRPHLFAELGFIWVQADGMGTDNRGKEFHKIAWKNLADAGFADRIAWMKAAAATRPWMDLGKVGIYGGSAGGQNAMRALLDHGDFYTAAVADCGCHDNRMDKIWWNEQWLGWPLDESYVKNSNVTDAFKLRGHLLLTVGEVDTNVDPASTMQVVDALVRADKDFELLVLPGMNHGAGESPYGARRRLDFFVRHLMGVEPRRE